MPCLTLMKSPFAKFRNTDDALQTALRGSAPRSGFPSELHDSIMNAVHSAHQAEITSISGSEIFRRLIKVSWLPVGAFAGLVLLGALLTIHHRTAATNQKLQPISEISNAFATSQELVASLPSVAVGPLSDELNKVNRDLDRTAEFLLATLP
jgi:hypothetical protein